MPDQSSKLYAILKNLDIPFLDCIIVTRPDADHCGGVAGALNYAKRGTCYCSVAHHDTRAFNAFARYLGGTSIRIPQQGEEFQIGDATATFVGAVGSSSADNSGSLVCRVDYVNTSFLLTGDAEFESEEAMIASGVSLKADVL